MKKYEIEFEKEVKQINYLVEYLNAFKDMYVKDSDPDDYFFKYYSGLLSDKMWNFRSLFFAIKLEPIYNYIDRFFEVNKRAPIILDIGCGYGLETRALALKGAVMYGSDYSAEKIERARVINEESKLEIKYVSENIFDICGDALYDAVWSSATLHHIEPANKAIQKISSIIKPGGKFFLSEENGLSVVQQVHVQKKIGWFNRRVLKKVDPISGKEYFWGNENIKTPNKWVQYMNDSGLRPEYIKYCRYLPSNTYSMSLNLKIERMIRNVPLINKLGAIGFLIQAEKIGHPPEN